MTDGAAYDRYLAGRMDAGEMRAFKAALREDSDRAADFVDYAVETALIVRVGSQMRAGGVSAVGTHGWWGGTMADWRRRAAPGLAAAAAAAALLAGGFVWGWHWRERAPGAVPGGDAGVSGTIVAIEGDATALPGIADSAPPPLVTGSVLRPGDGLRTGYAGRLRYVYADGTAVEVGPRSTVALAAGVPAAAKAVRLDAGALMAWIRPQPPSARMTFSTPHALATALGTTLRLNVTANRSELVVLDGQVAFAHGGSEMVVAGGQQVSVGSDGLAHRMPLLPVYSNAVLAVAGAGASAVSGLTRSVTVRSQTRNNLTVKLRVRNGDHELEAIRSGAVLFRGKVNTDAQIAALPPGVGEALADLLAEEKSGAAEAEAAVHGLRVAPLPGWTNWPGDGAVWTLP
jgi:hypothetical protein